MAAGKLSDINVTPLVDVLLVLLIIFMVTTAAAEQHRRESAKQDSVTLKTESLISLNLPVTPDNDYRANPDTAKLIVLIDRNLRVYDVRGLSSAGGRDPVADCSKAVSVTQWKPCFDLIGQKFGANSRMKKEGLYLEADADVPYGFVSGVLKTLRTMGLESVDIVTDPSFKTAIAATDGGHEP